jgi:phosphoribosylformimino-5-aminoimidazole carboxamide ribonucleotide (ProFAR) isomerase
VAFEVLPAIDLYQGRMARMIRGDRSTIETLDRDPVELLREWAAAGVHWVHIVDLDAAWGAAPSALDVLAAAGELGLLVEAGGGLSERGVAAALEHGATRAVLGAAALLQPGAVERAVAAHGDRVAVGLDVRGGVVAPRGTGLEGPRLDEAVRRLADSRPAMVVFTDADRDGSLAGPDLSALARVVEAIGVPVLASGGVRSAADVRALAQSRPAPAGVIVGRALHDGVLSIVEALAAATVD